MRKLKFATFLLVLMLLAGLNAIEVAAQTSELKLQSKRNGFTGEHISGNAKVFVEFQAPATDSTVSRIQNSNKQTIVEAVRDKDVVRVKVKDVTLAFYLDKKIQRIARFLNFPKQMWKNLENLPFPKNLHLSGN